MNDRSRCRTCDRGVSEAAAIRWLPRLGVFCSLACAHLRWCFHCGTFVRWILPGWNGVVVERHEHVEPTALARVAIAFDRRGPRGMRVADAIDMFARRRAARAIRRQRKAETLFAVRDMP